MIGAAQTGFSRTMGHSELISAHSRARFTATVGGIAAVHGVRVAMQAQAFRSTARP